MITGNIYHLLSSSLLSLPSSFLAIETESKAEGKTSDKQKPAMVLTEVILFTHINTTINNNNNTDTDNKTKGSKAAS